MKRLRDRLRDIFRPMPADSEAADCDECGRGIGPDEGHRDRARGKTWCSNECQVLGLERFAI